VNVRWGKQISEVEIWINFSIHNYGDDRISKVDAPIFTLALYDYVTRTYEVVDKRICSVYHGENEVRMRGTIGKYRYRLFVDDEKIWEGNLPQ